MEQFYFKDVSLLITHYNRSLSLERLLNSFQSINCSFGEIVVSNDGGSAEHQAKLFELQQIHNFSLITTPNNKGLGNNLNKGQDAVSLPYTLYVQEDFVPAADFGQHFTHAVEIINERTEIDIVRFYAYFEYPYLKPYKNGFSEMVFKFWNAGYKKYYYYSDHPHLRRSDFLKKFGRYAEGVKGDVTEYNMMMSFLQKKGKGMFYVAFKSLFEQENTSEEPSTMKRNIWRESNSPFIKILREAYRHVKFRYDYLYGKF
jgi:glycosyltransferase involved in cell wall biosynthesis